MNVSRTASAIFNDVFAGLSGYEATINISLDQLEDEVVEEMAVVIREWFLKNILPVKDLLFSLNCIPVDCASLDKCPCGEGNYSKPIAHFEIPQILTLGGEEMIEFVGSTDKSIKFKVYTSPTSFRFHKYKIRGANKPYVYIDTTPNEHNMYDGYIFNAPLLERLTVIAIFKDPRQLEQYSCCIDIEETENMSPLVSEVKKRLTEKKLRYYRQFYQQPVQNDQVPK